MVTSTLQHAHPTPVAGGEEGQRGGYKEAEAAMEHESSMDSQPLSMSKEVLYSVPGRTRSLDSNDASCTTATFDHDSGDAGGASP